MSIALASLPAEPFSAAPLGSPPAEATLTLTPGDDGVTVRRWSLAAIAIPIVIARATPIPIVIAIPTPNAMPPPPRPSSQVLRTNLSSRPNKGLEGVAYDANAGAAGVLYAVQEKHA